MAIVRVRAEVSSAVLDPESGSYVGLIPGMAFDAKHPLVREYPWAFVSDSDIEQATAAPGERRNR